MSAPRFVDCRCGHGKPDHQRDGFAPQCTASGCTCLNYRPKTAPDATPGGVRVLLDSTTGTGLPTAEQIIAAGRRSPFKRTAALADKVADQLAALRTALRDERQAVEAKRREEAARESARAEVALLERQLAEAKAKLRGKPAPDNGTPLGRIARRDDGEHPCTRPGCDRAFATSQARAMHERRAHDGFDPRAVSA
jgi:hypothetical protein